MSFKRYYPAGEEKKPDAVPAFWYLLKPHKAGKLRAGQTVKVKAALKRIEAEMRKGKKAC